MIENERETRQTHLLELARQIMTAARTAPKGKGLDIVEIGMATGSDIQALSAKMYELAEEMGFKFMLRDAQNILSAGAVILIGTRQQVQGLNCAHCGFSTCGEKPIEVPCAINVVDVGIAVGSACATAADLRVDTRVMFSAGLAAQRMGYLGKEVGCVMAIPLSISSKNPFFDRKITPA